MSTKFTYALILTVCQVVFSLVMYFLGFQGEKMATGQYFQWLGLVMTIAVLYLGMKAVRDEAPGADFSYGKAVGAGTMISLYAAPLGAIYTYIHFKFINPAFFDYQLEMMRQKWAAKGMSDTQIEQVSEMTQKWSGPGMYACVGLIMGFVICVLICLVLAAILKKPVAEEAATA